MQSLCLYVVEFDIKPKVNLNKYQYSRVMLWSVTFCHRLLNPLFLQKGEQPFFKVHYGNTQARGYSSLFGCCSCPLFVLRQKIYGLSLFATRVSLFSTSSTGMWYLSIVHLLERNCQPNGYNTRTIQSYRMSNIPQKWVQCLTLVSFTIKGYTNCMDHGAQIVQSSTRLRGLGSIGIKIFNVLCRHHRILAKGGNSISTVLSF